MSYKGGGGVLIITEKGLGLGSRVQLSWRLEFRGSMAGACKLKWRRYLKIHVAGCTLTLFAEKILGQHAGRARSSFPRP